MRGSISIWVTFAPRRAKHCASSQPMGPPPRTTRRRGSVRMSQTVFDVSGFASLRPGIGGTNGSAPAAITMLFVANVRFHRPGLRDLRRPLEALDAELRVAFLGIVRLDLLHDALHALHHLGEVEIG